MWKGLCVMNPTAAVKCSFSAVMCLTDLCDAANHRLVRLEIMSKRYSTLMFHKNSQTM